MMTVTDEPSVSRRRPGRTQPGRKRAWQSVLRLAWRHAWRRPLQSLFLIAGVAIGVAMIVGIDLANSSAQRAFELGTESVAGRATHEIRGGPRGLDQRVYIDLRRDLGYTLSAPVVEDYVIVDQLDRQPFRLLGVDPFAEGPFRSFLGEGGAGPDAPDYLQDLMAHPNTVLLSSETAERYRVAPGDTLGIRVGGRSVNLTVAGLLAPTDDLSRRALDTLLLADVATAQEVLGRVGRLDRVDLIVPEGAVGDGWLARIDAMLPPDARLEPAAARAGTVTEMTAAFRLNLTALSLLALVVGLFLIYNTVTFSVIQRRPVIGSLRALGMTRNEIFGMVLSEAVVLGLLGTLLGLGLGVLLGQGAVQLVTQTINDLFFVVTVREVDIPLETLVKGGVIGVLAATIGAALPAWEATAVPPAGAFQRSQIEQRSRQLLPWIACAAIVLLAIGALLLIPEWNLIVAFAGLFAVIVGCALLTPMLTLGLMNVVQWLNGQILGSHANLLWRMAPRTILRSLSRTSVAVAALMVAVSVIIGVGVMINSFRNTVELWLDEVLQADVFVSPPSLSANEVLTTLDGETIAWVESYPGVAETATTRGVDVAAYLDGEDAPSTTVRLVAVSRDLAGQDRRYRASLGDPATTWEAVREGAILVNEPMANRNGLRVGDPVTLQTDTGLEEFFIAGIPVDFDVNDVIFMADPIYRARWDDDAISAMGLFLEPGLDVDERVAQMRVDAAQRGPEAQEVIIQSNRGTRENALEVFDRTFAITVALQLLAGLVAFIGILSTLMSLQLERIREIGVLRATGMTRGQLWRLSLVETGLIGSSAGLIAIPTGLLLAVILIYIINLRSFGWTLEMQLLPGEFVRAFLVALIAALLAGIYPAWRMGRIQPADAVRSE